MARYDTKAPIVGSNVVAALLGAVVLVSAIFGAITVTGYIEAFGRDRGFLQLVAAIPVASLAASTVLRAFRVINTRQLLGATVPVELLILAGVGLFGGDFVAWYWAGVANVVVFVPWLLGIAVGGSLSRR